MKSLFEAAIRKGGYDLAEMLRRIDAYHVEGKLTDGERDALYASARVGADAMAGVDVYGKLVEFERRIAALEAGDGASDGADTEGIEEIPAFAVGKWYYTGDKITFDGKVYECIAPEGAVCTWSPADYPAYWTEITE